MGGGGGADGALWPETGTTPKTWSENDPSERTPAGGKQKLENLCALKTQSFFGPSSSSSSLWVENRREDMGLGLFFRQEIEINPSIWITCSS